LSYRGQSKGHYGDNSKHSRFSWGKKKPKDKEVIYVRDEEEKPKQIIPDTIHWQERPLPQGTQLIVSTPTSLTANGASYVLSNDLGKQQPQAFQICQLASSQKLKLEVKLPDGSSQKNRIINSIDQLPSDRAVDFNSMCYVGNLRNQLRANGFTLIYS
jgi:hypothetical protein